LYHTKKFIHKRSETDLRRSCCKKGDTAINLQAMLLTAPHMAWSDANPAYFLFNQ